MHVTDVASSAANNVEAAAVCPGWPCGMIAAIRPPRSRLPVGPDDEGTRARVRVPIALSYDCVTPVTQRNTGASELFLPRL